MPRPTACAGVRLAEQDGDRPARVGDARGAPAAGRRRSRPARPLLARSGPPRMPSGPSSVASSSAQIGTPVSTTASSSASSSAPRGSKPPCIRRSHRGLLDGRALVVGVEPDLAEEDAVGVRARAAGAARPRRRRESATRAARAAAGPPAASAAPGGSPATSVQQRELRQLLAPAPASTQPRSGLAGHVRPARGSRRVSSRRAARRPDRRVGPRGRRGG